MKRNNDHILSHGNKTSVIERQHLIADILPEYLIFCPACKNLVINPEKDSLAFKKVRIMHEALNQLRSYKEVAKMFGITRQRVGQIIKEYKKYGYVS